VNIQNFSDQVSMIGTGSPSANGLSSRSANLNDNPKMTIANGNTQPGQITTWYDDLRSLAGSPVIATVTGSPSAGTFTITVQTGGNFVNDAQVAVNQQTTANLNYNATASQVQTAVQALSNVGSAITVTGSTGGPWTLTPANSLGGIVISVTTSFTGGTSPGITLTNNQVANATTAPTFGSAATTGGSLVASTTLYAVYTYKNANGETTASAEGTYTVPAGTNTNTITLTAPSLPSGATGINAYVGSASGAESFLGTSSDNTFVITALPAAGAALPSPWNTTVFTSETIDLTNVKDANGNALSLKGVSCIHIENQSTTNPMKVFGGGTFAGPLSSPSTVLTIPPAVVVSGVTKPTSLHLPCYAAGGAWKVFGGVNNTLKIGITDPAGQQYAIVLPGCN
jgi:hypothetical protein